MKLDSIRIHPLQRLAYAFLGLLAGNAVLSLFVLQLATRERAGLLLIYVCFSLAGWILIGVPVVLVFPARSMMRLSWRLATVIGAGLGPLALLLVSILLARHHFTFGGTLRGLGWAWFLSTLISTITFIVYFALLRRRAGRLER